MLRKLLHYLPKFILQSNQLKLEDTQLRGHNNLLEGEQLFSNHVHHHQTETVISTIYIPTHPQTLQSIPQSLLQKNVFNSLGGKSSYTYVNKGLCDIIHLSIHSVFLKTDDQQLGRNLVKEQNWF